jgi:Plasmid pRiA4b ORF-3-like protein
LGTRLVAVPAVTRTIALLAAQTLDDLHHAIRNAHGWDDDHLYSFWLTGRYWADDGSTSSRSRPVSRSSALPNAKRGCRS